MTPAVTIVSTCSNNSMQKYGNRFLHTLFDYWQVPGTTFVFFTDSPAHWPKSLPLCTQYIELTLPTDLAGVGWHREFLIRHALDSKAHGRDHDHLGYRWDAARFSYKVAAIVETAAMVAVIDRLSAGYLLWLDADIVFHSPMTSKAFDSLLPHRPDEWLSWCKRSKPGLNYPECGFLLFDCTYAKHMKLMTEMQRLYDDDLIFKFTEWHDSFLWQQVVALNRVKTRDLSDDVARRAAHPMINGPLGAYLDHLKGGRKLAGISYASDLIRARNEPYWRQAG